MRLSPAPGVNSIHAQPQARPRSHLSVIKPRYHHNPDAFQAVHKGLRQTRRWSSKALQHLLLRIPELLVIRWHVVVAQCESRIINPAKRRCDVTRLRRDLCTYACMHAWRKTRTLDSDAQSLALNTCEPRSGPKTSHTLSPRSHTVPREKWAWMRER